MESYSTSTSALKKLTVTALCIATLSGCVANKPTYQAHRSPKIVKNAQGVPNYHLVSNGDTVSKIAQKYGLNYRQIARINALDSQYTIYSGQWLRLWTDATSTPPRPVRPKSPNQIGSNFLYPTQNDVFKQFYSGVSDGMWFSGKTGDPIYASQTGTVIYTGNGLPEFGQLIMIRHNNEFITAYAHNNQLLVSEGQYVQRGQKIATMGSSGKTDRVALEFQLRRNGSPIDPRSLLQK